MCPGVVAEPRSRAGLKGTAAFGTLVGIDLVRRRPSPVLPRSGPRLLDRQAPGAYVARHPVDRDDALTALVPPEGLELPNAV